MRFVKLRTVENSLAFLLPAEVARHMHAKEGDTLFMVNEPDGAVLITPYDPTFEQAMNAFERTRSRYRNALRRLSR